MSNSRVYNRLPFPRCSDLEVLRSRVTPHNMSRCGDHVRLMAHDASDPGREFDDATRGCEIRRLRAAHTARLTDDYSRPYYADGVAGETCRTASSAVLVRIGPTGSVILHLTRFRPPRSYLDRSVSREYLLGSTGGRLWLSSRRLTSSYTLAMQRVRLVAHTTTFAARRNCADIRIDGVPTLLSDRNYADSAHTGEWLLVTDRVDGEQSPLFCELRSACRLTTRWSARVEVKVPILKVAATAALMRSVSGLDIVTRYVTLHG